MDIGKVVINEMDDEIEKLIKHICAIDFSQLPLLISDEIYDTLVDILKYKISNFKWNMSFNNLIIVTSYNVEKKWDA